MYKTKLNEIFRAKTEIEVCVEAALYENYEKNVNIFKCIIHIHMTNTQICSFISDCYNFFILRNQRGSPMTA